MFNSLGKYVPAFGFYTHSSINLAFLASSENVDLYSIESVEDLIGAVLDRFAKFATEYQVNRWRSELFTGSIDYTNRDSIMDWYESIRLQYGPHLVGFESCRKSYAPYLADYQSLPQYNNMEGCGLCSQ